MTERDYQPALLWAKFVQYAQAHAERPPRTGGLQLFIYTKGEQGAYFLNDTGKLYWDETVGDGYFGNVEQSALLDNKDNLGEVVAYGITRERGPKLLAKSFEEFIQLLDGETESRLTNAEQIAEEIEAIIMRAREKGVHVFAYVQGGGQGGAYVTGKEVKSHLDLIKQTLADIESADDDTLTTFGGISYGL